MLQGLNPKHILDWINLQLARGVIGLDEKCVPLLAEGRGHAKIIKGRVVEIPQHRLGRGFLHRQIVMGVCPVGSGLLMATGAGGVADITRVSPNCGGSQDAGQHQCYQRQTAAGCPHNAAPRVATGAFAPSASQLASVALTSGKDKPGAGGVAASQRAVRSLSIWRMTVA